jgi:hypothetical protein
MAGKSQDEAIEVNLLGREDYFAYHYANAAATSFDEAASGKLLHARMTPHP